MAAVVIGTIALVVGMILWSKLVRWCERKVVEVVEVSGISWGDFQVSPTTEGGFSISATAYVSVRHYDGTGRVHHCHVTSPAWKASESTLLRDSSVRNSFYHAIVNFAVQRGETWPKLREAFDYSWKW